MHTVEKRFFPDIQFVKTLSNLEINIRYAVKVRTLTALFDWSLSPLDDDPCDSGEGLMMCCLSLDIMVSCTSSKTCSWCPVMTHANNTHTHTLSLSLSHTHSSLSLSLSLTHTHTRSLTCMRFPPPCSTSLCTCMHAHTHTRTHTHAHTDDAYVHALVHTQTCIKRHKHTEVLAWTMGF